MLSRGYSFVCRYITNWTALVRLLLPYFRLHFDSLHRRPHKPKVASSLSRKLFSLLSPSPFFEHSQPTSSLRTRGSAISKNDSMAPVPTNDSDTTSTVDLSDGECTVCGRSITRKLNNCSNLSYCRRDCRGKDLIRYKAAFEDKLLERKLVCTAGSLQEIFIVFLEKHLRAKIWKFGTMREIEAVV